MRRALIRGLKVRASCSFPTFTSQAPSEANASRASSTNRTALKPDLIAITGDFVDGTVKERRDDLAALKNLKAPYGVWGCEGNHEHYVDYEGWREELPKLGVKMLYNAHETIEVNGAPVVIAGVLDPMGRCALIAKSPMRRRPSRGRRGGVSPHARASAANSRPALLSAWI